MTDTTVSKNNTNSDNEKVLTDSQALLNLFAKNTATTSKGINIKYSM